MWFAMSSSVIEYTHVISRSGDDYVCTCTHYNIYIQEIEVSTHVLCFLESKTLLFPKKNNACKLDNMNS